MIQSLAPGISVAPSRIDGKGCFATAKFCQDQQIAEYVGERISLAEAERRRRAPGKISICDVNSEWSIDGSRGGNGTEYVNHSCEPNSYLVISEGRVFLHALREIIPGEEITTDYFYELKLEETECSCRMVTCLETTNLARITRPAQRASETPADYFVRSALDHGDVVEG
jgi:uncharacterized protein